MFSLKGAERKSSM
jgi:hypothetical protein